MYKAILKDNTERYSEDLYLLLTFKDDILFIVKEKTNILIYAADYLETTMDLELEDEGHYTKLNYLNLLKSMKGK